MASISDDFGRPDGPPGSGWVLVSGLWVIVSGQLSPGTSGATVVICAAQTMATSDHSAQITIAATTPVSQGVWCRGNSTLSSGYLLRNDGSSWAVFKVVGGTFTSIGTFAAAAVAGDVAKIQAIGSSIIGFVNGVARITLTDTAVTSGTSVGLRSMSTSGLRYDNFIAADAGVSNTGDAALASTATLTASGTRGTASGASLATTAALTADGVRATAGAAALATSATLTASGQRGTQADAATSTTATLTAAGQAGAVGDAALDVTAGLTAAGQRGAVADAELTTTATLTASGTVQTPQPQRDIDFTVTAAPERWTAREPEQSRWSTGAGVQRWTAREPDA